jgi:hypothetical protein
MLDALRDEIPTAVFRVTVGGEPRLDVEVTMDGKALFSDVPARAVELNPGTHRFVFKHRQLAAVEREVTITEGDRLVPIAVHFMNQPTENTANNALDSKPGPRRQRTIPTAAYVLGGVGVVGLAGFVGFGLATRSKESELKSTCSPGCSQDAINQVERRAQIADISLAVGAAALIAAAATYLFFGAADKTQPQTSWVLKPQMQPKLEFDF